MNTKTKFKMSVAYLSQGVICPNLENESRKRKITKYTNTSNALQEKIVNYPSNSISKKSLSRKIEKLGNKKEDIERKK